MKKLISIVLAMTLVFSLCAMQAGATNDVDVGKLADDFTLINGMTSANIKAVRGLIITEYKRGVKTRSVKHKGKAYFDYGNSTGEYVHAWVGHMQNDQQGNPFYNAAMNQDFTGGYSDSLATLGQAENWCCILVTLNSLAKNEAYTVRDGIANAWGNAGGTNSEWGMPTDNQRWIEQDGEMYCYQTFDWGYAIALKGQTAFVEWNRYDEGKVAPVGGELDYDWGIPESELNYKPDPIIPDPPEIVDIPIKYVDPDPEPNPVIDNPIIDNPEIITETPEDEEVQEDGADDQGEITAEVKGESATIATGKTSKASVTKTFFLGMEVGSPMFIGIICAVCAIALAGAVTGFVLIRKKKKTAIAGDDNNIDK